MAAAARLSAKEARKLLAAPQKRGNKYHAKRTTVDGVTFDSKAEANRYSELKLLEKSGKIRDLVLQPAFRLVVNGEHIGLYTGDFLYQEWPHQRLTIEDVKSPATRTTDYKLRVKLFCALYPNIVFRETGK